tara:strand:+ start:16926 stop:18401 length:1476 start_codon:yes stop_codon:yes gene_type:complete
MLNLLKILKKTEVSKSPTIIVIGDFMLDHYIFGTTSRTSPEAPVPIVEFKNENYSLGGAGNVVANLYELGANVIPIGIVGTDSAGLQLKKLIKGKNCDNTNLIPVNDRYTTIKTRILSANQQIVRLDKEEIQKIPTSISNQLIKSLNYHIPKADALIISDYAKGVCSKSMTQKIIEIANSHKVPVLVDPKTSDLTCYQGSYLITPNLKEFKNIIKNNQNISDKQISSLAKKLLIKHEIDNLLITKGSEGMSLVSSKKTINISADAKEVFDVSGAGDTVIATIAFSLAHKINLENSIHLANISAGIVVSKTGTATVTKEEIIEYIIEKQPTKQKIFNNKDDFSSTLSYLRSKKKKIVFTNGCFDLLHIGHISLLEQAAKLGDILIVAINSDNSVKRIKGNERPITTEQHRARILASISEIDGVILFNEDTPYELIKLIKPDVLVKGKDYKIEDVIGKDIVEKNGGSVELIDIVENVSTTAIANQITQLDRGS